MLILQIEKVIVQRAMRTSLHKAAKKVIEIVNRDKDHIPPITTTETNPFPYNIVVGTGRATNANQRMGIF
jgi:autophagy-related protein 101